jgi:hypothetical protein
MRRTETAEIALLPTGVVLTRIDAGAAQTLDNARDNLHGSIAECQGQKRPLLVDISRCQPLPPEVRHFYSGKLLTDSFLALGLLIEASPFGRMMGNVYLRVARPGIPTRLFSDEEDALGWLRDFAR